MSPYFRVSLAFIALMAALLLAALTAGCAPQATATVGEVARFQDAQMRMVLTGEPGRCDEPMRVAIVVFRGTPAAGCWMRLGERVLLDFEGEVGTAPAENFAWAPQV